MAKVEIKLNLAGINELMKGPEVQALLNETGAAVAARAGEGYEYRTHLADYIAITNVYPATRKAARENYETNSLLKALG